MSIERTINKLLSGCEFVFSQNLTFVCSYLALCVTAIYTSALASLSQLSTADQFNSTYIASQWAPGSRLVLGAQHTNLLKLPILWLQGKLPLSMVSYISLNSIFVVASFMFWTFLIYKLTRSKTYTIIANLLFCGLLLGSTELSISLTMTTQRNIEYTLAFAYLLIITHKLKAFNWSWWILSGLILGALISSDFFFLYTLPATAVSGAVFLYLKKRMDLGQVLNIMTNVLFGAIGGVSLLKLLSKLHVLTLFYEHSSVITYQEFWGQIEKIIFQVLRLFGGNIFGKPLNVTTLLALPALLYFVGFIYVVCTGTRRPAIYKNGSVFTYLVIFVVLTCLSYIMSGRATFGSDNIRHLTIIPFISVSTIVLFGLHAGKRSLNFMMILSVFVLMIGLFRIPSNYKTYQLQRNESQIFVDLDKNIITNLEYNDVDTAFGSIGYSATTWFFSHKSINVYNIVPCNKTEALLSLDHWYKPTGEKFTALIVDRGYPSYAKGEAWSECSDKLLVDTYGEPLKKTVVGRHDGEPVEVWIFNHDIRSNMDHR